MSVKKLTYYLRDSKILLRSDHLPLKKFLLMNTKNDMVNNWAMELQQFPIQFEYIEGNKNTLADTMSRLVKIDPDLEKEPEKPDQEFGKYVFDKLNPVLIDAVFGIDQEENKENSNQGKDLRKEDECRVPCYCAAVSYTLPRLRALQGSNLCEANSHKHQW